MHQHLYPALDKAELQTPHVRRKEGPIAILGRWWRCPTAYPRSSSSPAGTRARPDFSHSSTLHLAKSTEVLQQSQELSPPAMTALGIESRPLPVERDGLPAGKGQLFALCCTDSGGAHAWISAAVAKEATVMFLNSLESKRRTATAGATASGWVAEEQRLTNAQRNIPPWQSRTACPRFDAPDGGALA